MRAAILYLLASATLAQAGSIQQLLISQGSASLSLGSVDVFIDGNGTATGTTVTSTNLGTATHGTYVGWELNGTVPMTFHAGQVSGLPGSVTVIGGSTYPASYATQSLAYDHSAGGGSTIQIDIPDGHPVCASAGWITLTEPTSLFQIYDDLGLFGGTGKYTMFQVNNGVPYFGNIESDGDGTLHSGEITDLLPPQRVWMSLWESSTPVDDPACLPTDDHPDWTSPCPLARLNLYSAGAGNAIGTQIGSTVAVKLNAAIGNCAYSRIGNNEFSTSSTTELFGPLVYQWTNPVFPLIAQ
jgi:hypothetical protein